MNTSRRYHQLIPEQLVTTIKTLDRRIQERFPDSGLSGTCKHLVAIAQLAKQRAEWIGTPIIALRSASWFLAGLIVLGVFVTLASLRMPHEYLEFSQTVALIESGINDVVFIGVAIFFLLTFETRLKRSRALKAIHELRVIAHIIDMHQLTKDPEHLLSRGPETASSPQRQMNAFELSRYLDYCSEMLSLIGKIGALYVQHFEDEGALAAVNEVETLTTGLSRKIWQKLMILHSYRG